MVAAGADPADRPRAQATSSVTLGRSCGLGLRQRTTTSRNAEEKSAGSTMASLGSPKPDGGQRVSASNRLTPSAQDRKSTRLNSSHEWISYAVFCLKKKKNVEHKRDHEHRHRQQHPQLLCFVRRYSGQTH